MHVLLVGDMYQLPPVRGVALWSKAPRDPRRPPFRRWDVEVLELNGQVRAQGHDMCHMRMIAEMRRSATSAAAVRDFVSRAKYLRPDDAAEFGGAAILVYSNEERNHINAARARYLARCNAKLVFVISNGTEVRHDVRVPVTLYFTEGAPALLTDNIDPAHGLANGTSCVLVSLGYDQRRQPPPGNLNDLQPGDEVPAAPAVVVVRVLGKELALKRSDGTFPVELAFALTFHKAQGATLSKVVLQLNKRPGTLGRLNHAALYVALTRVKDPNDIRLCSPSPSFSLHYMLNLKPNKDIEEWLRTRMIQLPSI
jgi:hypothetical protein